MLKILTLSASTLALLCVILAGPLYKYEVLSLIPAMKALRFGTVLAFAAIVLLFIELVFYKKSLTWGFKISNLVMAGIALAIPLSMMLKAQSLPMIHDITTDTLNPPVFEQLLPDRKNAMNPAEYPGSEVAAQQKQAYPQIEPLLLQQDKRAIFNAALEAVKQLEIELIHADFDAGLIEATATSFWFGFKDDLVFRLSEQGDLWRLDIRSKSRVGKSDLGKNAERIEQLLKLIQKELAIK
ncbi:DUF1499 domain-containing protein [Gayadomonas joobiniege]|uniref:DUF1499 domain-containing protein n=1 Tax=Gayadomonas joobiniege TaxID=1234606 RepID=UPI00037F938F|nr:DUF1499 domain-containing protein [Gayadomonas joobiniege]